MEQNRKKDFIENQFGKTPRAHIYALYQEGKFYHLETQKEVILSEGAYVMMVTSRASIPDEDYQRFAEIRIEKVLDAGTTVFIKIPIVDQGEYIITVKLHDDLMMKKTGNKDAVVEPCRCEIIDRKEHGHIKNPVKFEPFAADSLNQAFFQASIRYRPENKSHTTNIYQSCFLEDGKSLSVLRF